MMRCRALTTAVLAMTVVVASTVVAADGEHAGAYLATKPSNDYAIKRNSSVIPQQFFMPLSVGDVVSVVSPTASVVLEVPGSKPIIVCRASHIPMCSRTSPYTIEAPPPKSASHSAENVFEKISLWLTREKQRRVDLVGRGDQDFANNFSFAIPGLSNCGAQIASGHSVYGVAWRGGTPPFTVTVRDGEGSTVLNETKLFHHELIEQRDPPHFATGTYTLIVEDKDHPPLTGCFRVTSDSAFPALPAGLTSSVADPETKILLDAAWLAQTGDASFLYEAYLRALPLTLVSPRFDDAFSLEFGITHPAASH